MRKKDLWLTPFLSACLLVLFVFIFFNMKTRATGISFWLLINDVFFLISLLCFLLNKRKFSIILACSSFLIFCGICILYSLNRIFAPTTLIRLVTLIYMLYATLRKRREVL
ncbi:MAG: hypothetical protein Ta2A_08760 [Treponemataceae bacterium]|nr:MAG: hypothetical protein Ta2A_08760 [Treponemataceae bacterium]